MAGTLCGRMGLAAALELEFELGEAGDSAPLLFSPKLMPFGVSPFWLPLLPMWFPWLAADPPPCCLEPRMLSMVNRDAAAAPPRLSSSRMVTPDWLPSSEEGV